MSVDPIKLDDLLPSAHSFTLATCGDPQCGVHLISLDRDGVAILQTVMSRDQMKDMIATFYKILRTQNP